MSIRAVIFDLDGTITQPYLDFDAIRVEIGMPGEPILEAMERMPPADRERAEAILHRHEAAAAANSALNAGATRTLDALRANTVPLGLLTRNSRQSARVVLQTHRLVFDHVHTREDGPLKPSPEPVRSICRALNVEPADTLMVGDYLFDIQAGRSAGARTALIVHDKPPPDYAHLADHVIREISEVLAICGLGPA